MNTPRLPSSWIAMKPSSELVFLKFAQPWISGTHAGDIRILAFNCRMIGSSPFLALLVLAI